MRGRVKIQYTWIVSGPRRSSRTPNVGSRCRHHGRKRMSTVTVVVWRRHLVGTPGCRSRKQHTRVAIDGWCFIISLNGKRGPHGYNTGISLGNCSAVQNLIVSKPVSGEGASARPESIMVTANTGNVRRYSANDLQVGTRNTCTLANTARHLCH